MILPSIDLQGGRAVQLVGGEALAIDGGDPLPWAERFAVAGEIAVVDLDAALGRGRNDPAIEALLRAVPADSGRGIRVGGGIRTAEDALRWLDAGASRVVIGTAATPEFLDQLPRERVVVALDARDGEVVVEGWRRGTGRGVAERMGELRERCGGFLVTFVEKEGRMEGTRLDEVASLRDAAGEADLTIAGGITAPEDIAALAAMGASAQLGMALYSGRLDLADAIAAPLRSERVDGLWPTVVCDERGVSLGLAWSSAESLREAVATRTGVYQSRNRGLWRKGESSGATQELLRVDVDCDADALRFTVRQSGSGFCHLDTRTCFGADRGLGRLERRLRALREASSPQSYTARLFRDPTLLDAKLLEEAEELVDAVERADVVHEAADVLYFTLAKLAREGIPLADVEAELDRRERRVRRRASLADPGAATGRGSSVTASRSRS